ncbi:hypothetical protein EYD10_09602 [Varanus komodoensis]|nr:hypothetical protein EYD10_09602 [Varanus komodoensis]
MSPLHNMDSAIQQAELGSQLQLSEKRPILPWDSSGRNEWEGSKKRGLSVEEKRTRMMEIFFETKDVFQLKDIEKIAPKEKGITAMSVKEILQSLVDDGMVDTDRIGTSNYFWAFPSKALHTRKRKLEDLQIQIYGRSPAPGTLSKRGIAEPHPEQLGLAMLSDSSEPSQENKPLCAWKF